ncbi:MAG: hypothetical protein KJ607_01760, partial [Bacteroidetes bacterium]|nr:hypothetical protein [Bacteroidota bacterium]
TVRMTYTDLRDNSKVTLEEKVSLDWTEETGKTEMLLQQEEKKLYAIAIMNQALKVMAESYAAGDIVKAFETLNRTAEQVKEIFPTVNDADVNKLLKELNTYVMAFLYLQKK